MPVTPFSVQRADTDVLVLGGGLSGFRAAVAARELGVRVTMAYRARGASPYVIGFNAPIGAEDSRDHPEIFFEDMIRGGYGLNDRRLARVLAYESITAFHELSALSVPFAQRNGKPAQRHLSGNTYPRSVYIPEGTGAALLRALKTQARALGVASYTPYSVVDLLRDGREVVGALLWRPRSDRLLLLRARAVVIATGGIGRLYDGTTYPHDVAADTLGLAMEAGAVLQDMEFVQFEPVVTVWPEECRGMEMPTAMIGDGAHLRNAQGERFMLKANPPLGERGIEKARMALHIQRELDEGRGLPPGGVIFDTTLLAPERLESYVSHCSRLRRAGLDPARQGPLVAPAAHSVMGGVSIDESAFTGVQGLFAGGEAAGGVHGASRVAGNGGADTLVFGAIAGRSAARSLRAEPARDWELIESSAMTDFHGTESGEPIDTRIDDARRATAVAMVQSAGIWRDAAGLAAGDRKVRGIRRQLLSLRAGSLEEVVALKDARRMTQVALTIITAAAMRTESRGSHQRTDFPNMDDARWYCHISFAQDPGGDLKATRTCIN